MVWHAFFVIHWKKSSIEDFFCFLCKIMELISIFVAINNNIKTFLFV